MAAEAGDDHGAGPLVADLAPQGVADHGTQATWGPRWRACATPALVPRALMAQQMATDLWAEEAQ